MSLDDKMSKEAEEYAKKLASMESLQHSDTDYGENLAMKCSSQKEDEMTAEEATKNWYDLRLYVETIDFALLVSSSVKFVSFHFFVSFLNS